MKFATKLTLVVLLLLNFCVGLVSTILLQRNFDSMLTDSCGQYARMQISLCRSIRDSVQALPQPQDAAARVSGIRRAAESAGAYLGVQYARVYVREKDGTAVYKNLPEGFSEVDAVRALEGDHRRHLIYPVGDAHYAGFCMQMEAAGIHYQVFSVYDVSNVFAQRDIQRRSVLVMMLILLPVSAAAVWGVCTLLTRNIRRLESAAAAIAGGAYEQRSGIAGGDEIASLSRSFDDMAGTVEETIRTLQQNLHQREEFVAAFTHEIKTPMTTMIGYSDLLRSQSCDAETVHLAAGYIHAETSRLASLSHNLLMLLGLSREKAELQTMPFSLLLQRLQESLGELPGGVRLAVEAGGECNVAVQPDLVLVLLRNLVQNAARAKPRDGRVVLCCEKRQRSLDAECAAPVLAVTVSDTGCGIPEKDLPHVTQPFYMVDKSRARSGGGSGIGLALCERIAALHGSHLSIESTVGVGTAVTVELPATE